MACFLEVFQETEGFDHKFAIHTFLGGLLHDDNGIHHSLTKSPSEDVGELIDRIEKYSQLEDGRKTNEGDTKEDKGKKVEASSSKRNRKDG